MKININGIEYEAKSGSSILEAAKSNGISIPTLCYLKQLNTISECRVCLVEANGALVPACSTAVSDGMMITTDSARVKDARRNSLELILSDHAKDCTVCPRGNDCELQNLSKEFEADAEKFGIGKRKRIVDEAVHLVRDNSKCILCRRCASVCSELQGINAISVTNRGGETAVGFAIPNEKTGCVNCGRCVSACPTGALSIHDDTKKFWKAVYDKNKYVVVMLSPNACNLLDSYFNTPGSSCCAEKAANVLKRIGADLVVKDNVLQRSFSKLIQDKIADKLAEGNKTALSSTCPAWRNYIDRHCPEYSKLLISAPSCKEFTAEKIKSFLNDKDVCIVSVSNCISAKSSHRYVDIPLTVRELFYIIRQSCVSSFTASQVWETLEPEEFDALPFFEEPVERTANFDITESEMSVKGKQIKTLRISGLANCRNIEDFIGKYSFINVNACNGGCKYGGEIPVKAFLQKKEEKINAVP